MDGVNGLPAIEEGADGSTREERIISTALDRWKRSNEHWSDIRDHALNDMRFLLGDSENNYQWPQWAASQRKIDERPMLTINKLPAHVAQVTNEVRQNPPQSKVRPVDDRADVETARVFTGLIRHIWSNNDASFAITNACDWQVGAGYGYFRVVSDWVADGSMEQEIYVKAIADPTSVWDDPSIQTPTGSDRNWCFICEDMARAEFREQYPDAEESDFDGGDSSSWWAQETVRVAEYYTLERKKKTLLMYADGSTAFEGEAGPAGVEVVRTRVVDAPCVYWRKITASQILEEREIPGQYIPLVRVVGTEKIVNGERIVKGITRNAKNAQQMYNFNASAYAERVNMAPKAPFIGPAGFMEGFEGKWQKSNKVNYAALEYTPVYDDNGNPLPPPARQAPPDVPVAYVQGMMLSSDDIKSTTGQHDASLGARSNETSGKAILARQREGDIGTFHYLDNLAKGMEYAARIIVSQVPYVYDTARVLRILGEDGEEEFASINPEAEESYEELRGPGGDVQKIYNLSVGRYDVVASAGPSFTTKRQEASEFFTAMVQADPSLLQKAGDIMLRHRDDPGAQELADRLKLFLPPEIAQAESAGQPMPPEVQAAMQQVQQQEQMLAAKMQEMQSISAQMEQEKNEIEGQKAELGTMLEKIKAEHQAVRDERDMAVKDVQMQELRLENKRLQVKLEEANALQKVQAYVDSRFNEGNPNGTA